MEEKTILVIPAYNEERVIAPSLRLARGCLEMGLVSSFIVVDDHSTDRTAEIAAEYGATVLPNYYPKNGKGECFLTALEHCVKEKVGILAMLDADIMRAYPSHLMNLLNELIGNPRAHMAVHPVDEGYNSAEDRRIGQQLSGARAIRVKTAYELARDKDFRKACSGFGLEVSLNKWIFEKYGRGSILFLPSSQFQPIEMWKHLRRPAVFAQQGVDIGKAVKIIESKFPNRR